MNLSILGYMGSGKTSIAKRFVERYNYVEHSFAQELKDIAEIFLGRKIDKAIDRPLLVQMSYIMKNINTKLYGDDKILLQEILKNPELKQYWNKHKYKIHREYFFPYILCNKEQFKKSSNEGKSIIHDMRFKIEPHTLKHFNMDFKMVRLDVPREICEMRLFKRDGYVDPSWFDNDSEQEWKTIKADVVIRHAYTKKIDEIVGEIIEKLGIEV
jgi:adenylate kinase family enzyme